MPRLGTSKNISENVIYFYVRLSIRPATTSTPSALTDLDVTWYSRLTLKFRKKFSFRTNLVHFKDQFT
jgi:hypothetical protein